MKLKLVNGFKIKNSIYIKKVLVFILAFSFFFSQSLYLFTSSTLASTEKFTNTDFETDLTGWTQGDANWWLSGEVSSSNAIAAYQAEYATSQNDSYTNLANPGTYNAIEAIKPGWDSTNGWIFNGVDTYLGTGFGSQVMGEGTGSAILRFSNVTGKADINALFGADRWSDALYFGNCIEIFISYTPGYTGMNYYNGDDIDGLWQDTTVDHGVAAIAGNKAYLNSSDIGNIPAWNEGLDTDQIIIGATNVAQSDDVNTVTVWSTTLGNIQAIAFYNTTLTTTQISSITTAMNNLTGNSAYKNTTTKYTGNASSKVIATSDFNFIQSVNVENASTYNLVAYAYTDGSAVTSSDAELYVNGSIITTTYTDADNGWYKLSRTITGADGSRDYGVQVKAGKTVYLDDLSLLSTSNGSGGGLPLGYYNPPYPGHNGFKIAINNNDASTNSREVNLTLEAGENVRYVAVSEKNDLANTGFGVFKPEVFNKSFTLSEGDGLKRIYAQFRTEYIKFSDIIYDEIILNTNPPTEQEQPIPPEEMKPNENTESPVIIDGDLIRTANTFDIYIVKIIPSTGSEQAEKFKRLILNPNIFNQYKHLKWSNVKEVSQEILNQHTTSDLVRALGDTKVYKLYSNGDIGEKRWIKTLEDFLFFAYDWDSVYTINNYERDNYDLGLDLTSQ